MLKMNDLQTTFLRSSEYFQGLAAASRGDARSPRSRRDFHSDQEFEWIDDDEDFEYKIICEQIRTSRTFPTTPLFHLYKRKCQIELDRGEVRDAAVTLLQCQAISMRHQALKQLQKKVLQQQQQQVGNDTNEPVDGGDDDDQDEESKLDEIERRILTFPESDHEILFNIGSLLPSEWRVVQLSVDTVTSLHPSARFKSEPNDEPNVDQNFSLMMVTVQCGNPQRVDSLGVLNVAAVQGADNPTIMKEFHDIVLMHGRLYKTDKYRKEGKDKYKEMKIELDDRMRSLMDTMENKWLGFAKCLLFGRPADASREAKLTEAVDGLTSTFFQDDERFESSGRKQVLGRLMDGGHSLTPEQLDQGLKHCLEGKRPDLLPTLADQFRTHISTLDDGNNVKRHPVILILDREIQNLPWESLACLQLNPQPQPVTRIPSIAFLCALTARQRRSTTSVARTGVRDSKIFYVLNPDKNLDRTQKRLQGSFHDLNLGDGVVGTHPSLPKMKEVLSEMDAYVYCGHGSNMKNMPAQEIEKLNVRALPLLFGCNSGRLSRMGRHLDPIGVASYYLIGSAPCLLGFLWSITDRDVDKWTVQFLHHWLGKGDGPHESVFVRAVANQRCKFDRITNGAAMVVYGLPIV